MPNIPFARSGGKKETPDKRKLTAPPPGPQPPKKGSSVAQKVGPPAQDIPRKAVPISNEESRRIAESPKGCAAISIADTDSLGGRPPRPAVRDHERHSAAAVYQEGSAVPNLNGSPSFPVLKPAEVTTIIVVIL